MLARVGIGLQPTQLDHGFRLLSQEKGRNLAKLMEVDITEEPLGQSHKRNVLFAQKRKVSHKLIAQKNWQDILLFEHPFRLRTAQQAICDMLIGYGSI